MTQQEKITEATMARLRAEIKEPNAAEEFAKLEERQRRERKEAFAEFVVEIGLVALIVVTVLITMGVVR